MLLFLLLAVVVDHATSRCILSDTSEDCDMVIPTIMHQIWWQGANDMAARADQGKDAMRNSPDWRAQFVPRWIHSWSVHHPAWEHRMWDETMIIELAQELGYHDFILSLPERIKKIDFARYMILHKYGGVVLDVDFEAFKPIDQVLRGSSVVLIEESENQSINCASIASIPNHPLWIKVLNEIALRQRSSPHNGVMYITGPRMLTDVSMEWIIEEQQARLDNSSNSEDNDKIRILRHATGENRLFYPYHADHMVDASNREKMSSACSEMNNCALRHPKSYAMHHFAATWYDEYARQIGL